MIIIVFTRAFFVIICAERRFREAMQTLQLPSSAWSQIEMSHWIEIGSLEPENWKLVNWNRASGVTPLDRIVVSASEAHAFSIRAYSRISFIFFSKVLNVQTCSVSRRSMTILKRDRQWRVIILDCDVNLVRNGKNMISTKKYFLCQYFERK